MAPPTQAQLSELVVRPSRLHPPARVHRDGDGAPRWLPAALLGKTANRRPTRPWAARVIVFINLRLSQLGAPVLNKRLLARHPREAQANFEAALHMSTENSFFRGDSAAPA